MKNIFLNKKWHYVILVSIVSIFAISFLTNLMISCKSEAILRIALEEVVNTKEVVNHTQNGTHTKASLSVSAVEQVEKMQKETVVDNVNIFNISLEKMKDLLVELHDLKSSVFEANTITFLVSFTLALLFTILLSIQDRMSQHMKTIQESEKFIVKFKKGIIRTSYIQRKFTRIYHIYNGVVMLNYMLASENQLVSSKILTIVYMIDREVRSILNNKSEYDDKLNIEDKRKLVEILADCVNNLNIKELKSKKENKSKLASIISLNDNLIELRNRIRSTPIEDFIK